MLMAAALDGFLVGGSLIVAIGAQNAFVLRQGLARRFVLPVVLVCALSDAMLIAAGVAGLGALVRESRVALHVVTVGGALFLFLYGLRAFWRASRPAAMTAVAAGGANTRAAAIGACLAFTFLNPHVYLDTVLLIGSLSARHAGAEKLSFAGGAMLASFAWFFGLGYGARLLTPLFARPRAWQLLDVAIGLVMWALAAKLAAGILAWR